VAKKLKQQWYSSGKEIDSKESAKTLRKSGVLYGNKTTDKLSLIQSVCLMTSGMVRNPRNVNKIKQDLEEVCKRFLELAVVHGRYEIVSSVVTITKQQNQTFKGACAVKMTEISQVPKDVHQSKLKVMQLKEVAEINNVQCFTTKTYII